MEHQIYADFVAAYALLDPAEEHREEVEAFLEAFQRAGTSGAKPGGGSLLELGSGAGNNGLFLKQRFACTLTDLSEGMLDLSRQQNPDCEHLQGDMRNLRVGRQFDAVLVHDAITYMTTEAELGQVLQTAYEHTREGGITVVAPDHFKGEFDDYHEVVDCAHAGQALKGVAWAWDQDPEDDYFYTDYALLWRTSEGVVPIYERHVEGLFSRQVWLRLLQAAGFSVELGQRPVGEGGYGVDGFGDFFICKR